MILGLILMIMGGIMTAKNREIAVYFAPESRWGFLRSVARQNIAVVGALVFIAGLALCVFILTTS